MSTSPSSKAADDREAELLKELAAARSRVQELESRLARTPGQSPDPAESGQARLAEALAALKESDANLAKVQRIAHLGHWVWDETKQEMTSFSDQVPQILGILSGPAVMTTSECLKRVHPEDRQRYEAIVNAAEKRARGYELAYRIVRPDGEIRHIQETAEAEFDQAGNFVRTLGAIQDITELKRAEEALREGKARYREIFDESPAPLLEEDWRPVKEMLDGLKTRGIEDLPAYFRDYPQELGRAYEIARRYGISKAVVKLYRAASLADLRASMTMSAADPDELEGYGRMIAAFHDGATSYQYEAEEIACDGSEIVTRIRAVIPPNYRETWSLVLITIEDITERRQAELAVLMAKTQAEIANRAKSEFLANMSHELRTPLNAVIGFAEIMKEERLGPLNNSRYREYLDDIHSSGQHLLALINDILDLSKIEAGKTTLNEDAVDVAEILHICLRLIDARAAKRGLELVTELPGEPLPGLRADPRLVKQILINLLSNAVKFTPSGGRVTVSLQASPEAGFLLQVADTGIGMSRQDIPSALTRFQQIDSQMNRRFQGTGLGLPLTKSLTELHGGTLEIESALGEGTTVTVRFPSERLVPRRNARPVTVKRTAVGT